MNQPRPLRCHWVAKVFGFLMIAGFLNMKSSQQFFQTSKTTGVGGAAVDFNQVPLCNPRDSASAAASAAAAASKPTGNVIATQEKTAAAPPKLFKFILFTTARSGSTWTCQLLDALPNITCGLLRTHLNNGATNADDELLLKYSWMGNGCCPKKDAQGNKLGYGDLTWQQYQQDFDTALHKSIQAKQQPHSSQWGAGRAAGFKLMYDQIPPMFLDQLLKHCVDQDIAILHMVREATILRMASVDNYMTKKRFGSGLGLLHTTNTSLAALNSENAELVTFNANATLGRVRGVESIDATWQRRLAFYPGLRYHYVSYESLLSSPSREVQLWQVLSFLKPFLDPIPPPPAYDDGSTTTPSSSSSYHALIQQAISSTTLLQLHQPLCSKRIQNYDELRLKLEGTRTASACDLLENMNKQ